MRSIKLYGSGSASANAVAQVVIPSRARIVGVQYNVIFDCTTDGASLYVELSRASSREIAVNGAQQCVIELAIFSNFVTSGLSQPALNGFLPVDVEMEQGQILYQHATVSGTVAYTFTGVLWLK